MHYIFIQKKENFKDDHIDEEFLNQLKAPSLISKELVKFNLKNITGYVYLYNHIYDENFGKFYHTDDNGMQLINGLVCIDNVFYSDINEFFNNLDESSDLMGDYQLLSLDKKGNGFIKTPPISVYSLYFYEDENCKVLSTDKKLIVDCVKKFSEQKFVNHFDVDFIDDATFREWAPRNVPQNTLFKQIKRVFPSDDKYFVNGDIVIERKESIEVPQWFREEYEQDKNKLYDKYYDILINFTESSLIYLKPMISKIELGLTGGFDSRLAAAVLSGLCKKHEIPFECYSFGVDEHPDVTIPKEIARVLDVKHIHIRRVGKTRSSQKYEDYVSTFYIAQGDFNSKNMVGDYNRRIKDPNIISQLGYDGYKRLTMDQSYSANRWKSRVVLSVKNFSFPLFFTKYESWFARLYNEQGSEFFKEFVYEVLKRSEPELLDIPFAGNSLPYIDVEPHGKWQDSKFHDREPFLWDYKFVRNNMKPAFIKKFDEDLGMKSKLIFKIMGLNEFDYFINKELSSIVYSYRRGEISLSTCVKKLKDERFSKKYPRKKTNVEVTKELMTDPYIKILQIIMDFAAGADKKTYREMEFLWE